MWSETYNWGDFMFMKPGETPDIELYPAESSHQKMVKCGHKGKHMVSNNTSTGCGIQTMIDWYQGAQTLTVNQRVPYHDQSVIRFWVKTCKHRNIWEKNLLSM